jgi:hypothetical protein
MLRVFRDEAASRRDRTEAATWLADRGFGRPTQTQLTGSLDTESDVDRMSLPELRQHIAELVSRVSENLPAGASSPAEDAGLVDGG